MSNFGIVMPFWIDTDAYTDRDRLMFVCGVEFEMLRDRIAKGFRGKRDLPIHTENESRVRMMCARMGVICQLEATGQDGWTYIEIFDK